MYVHNVFLYQFILERKYECTIRQSDKNNHADSVTVINFQALNFSLT